jgi:hypothetical protein
VAAEEFRHRRWKESKFKDFALNEFPVFFDLTESPQRWRGKPISLFGHIRLHRVAHQENAYGIDPIHEAYLYTGDSQSHPATIIFAQNPDRIPVGEETIRGIQVTGYFLKLYNYPSRDGKVRYSPIILAKEIRQIEIPAAGWSTTTQLVIVGGLLVLLLIGWILWSRSRVADLAAREKERHLLGRDAPPDFTQLDAP